MILDKRLLINHEYSFIYCPIYKVASSSFRIMMILLNQPSNSFDIIKLDKFYNYVNANYSLASYTETERKNLLNDPNFFKFAFVRNPWSKLASAYLNKFVHPKKSNHHFLLEVINKIYQKKDLEPNYQKSITFKEFVEYLALTEDSEIDNHWKPQHLFLENIQFDFIGRFENLVEDFNYIKERLNIKINLPYWNKSGYSQVLDNEQNFANYYPYELNQLQAYPSYYQFYNYDLIELVRKRYRKDIEMFSYEFKSK
jgi:hypothetical protein